MEHRPRIISITRPQTVEDKAYENERLRREELRRNFLVPIHVMWTSDVPKDEALAGFQGVLDAVNASQQKREVKNFGSSVWGEGPFSSADWYLNEAIKGQKGMRKNPNHGGFQIVTYSIGGLFYEEPWQESPHWEVVIINKDLTTGEAENNYVLGATSSEFAYSVQSVTRLEREIPDQETRAKVIRRLLRHEVGHMFGLPSYSRINTEQKLGRHCTNVCTMRQGMNSIEWIKEVNEESAAGVHFCNDCMVDLQRFKSKYKPLPK